MSFLKTVGAVISPAYALARHHHRHHRHHHHRSVKAVVQAAAPLVKAAVPAAVSQGSAALLDRAEISGFLEISLLVTAVIVGRYLLGHSHEELPANGQPVDDLSHQELMRQYYERNDPEIMYKLACYFARERNETNQLMWLKRAANDGHERALNDLKAICEAGSEPMSTYEAVSQEYEKAVARRGNS